MKHTLPKAFLMPGRCACCLAPAESYLESSFTKTTWLVVVSIRHTARIQIPYCHACRGHVEASAGWKIFLITVAIFFGGWFVSGLFWSLAGWLYPGIAQSALTTMGLLLPPGLALAYLVREILDRGRTPGPGHIRNAPAATLVDFTDATVTLEIYNSKFLALLKRAQEAPVVSKVVGPSRPNVAPPSTNRPPPKAVSTESVRRRLATIPRDGRPERVLRFVAFKCEIVGDGLVARLHDGTSRGFTWADVTTIYARRLPHEPPWERMLVMDLVPVSGPPVRLLTTTSVNFGALPGGAASSHLENCRRLAAHVETQNPAVEMDPETRSFVSGFGPCAALLAIEQFMRYDDQFDQALQGFGPTSP